MHTAFRQWLFAAVAVVVAACSLTHSLHFCLFDRVPVCWIFVVGFLFRFWLIRYCSCLRVLLSVFLVGFEYSFYFIYLNSSVFMSKIYWAFSFVISLSTCCCFRCRSLALFHSFCLNRRLFFISVIQFTHIKLLMTNKKTIQKIKHNQTKWSGVNNKRTNVGSSHWSSSTSSSSQRERCILLVLTCAIIYWCIHMCLSVHIAVRSLLLILKRDQQKAKTSIYSFWIVCYILVFTALKLHSGFYFSRSSYGPRVFPIYYGLALEHKILNRK